MMCHLLAMAAKAYNRTRFTYVFGDDPPALKLAYDSWFHSSLLRLSTKVKSRSVQLQITT